MFEQYIPRRFCREFVEAQGHGLQLSAFMAVVAGLKPCTDVWIPIGRVGKFRAACRRYGLLYRADVNFEVVPRKDLSGRIVGKENLTTTFAFGRPVNYRVKSGKVHFFIARTRDALETAFRYGWYPVIINGRVMEKLLADAYRFGYALGYPSCCVEFFQRYNNWWQYNFIFEVLKNTVLTKAHFLCNPFSRDWVYSYISHMPCSYNCVNTRGLAERLRTVIMAEEPAFANQIDRHLKLPYLVFYERKFYAFDGEFKGESIYYRKVYFSGNGADYNLYEADLRRGDRLMLNGDSVVIFKKGRCIKTLTPQKVSFGQEKPMFVQFKPEGMAAVYGRT